ncbi:MAG: amino acid ABC transporter substrate-binding protein [Desulfobacteraceae bacterium]|nr:amino acid ABC transporter substrate-binding protein [Desulfobacteraceae bacterium]
MMIAKASIITVFMVFSLCQTAVSQKLAIAYVDFPPYEYMENGQPAGIMVAIVKRLFRKADIEYELQYLPFKRAYNKVKLGRIDGLFNFYKIPERLAYFDYSKPIIQNPLVFFIRKESKITFQELKDLSGLTVGAMLGYTYGSEFDNTTLFVIDRAVSHFSNFSKLFYGRIDAYPCDKLVGIYLARKHKMMSEFIIIPRPLKVMDGHIGFTKGKHTKIIERLNTAIDQVKQDNTIDNIINAYLEKNR